MNEKDAVLALWNKTSGLIDEKISYVYYDKTFPSVVYGKNDDGTYKIVREGKFYNVKCALGHDLKVTQSVWVTMPSGQKNLKDMYISGIRGENKSPITSGGSGGDITKQGIIDALGYTPSSKTDVSSLQTQIDNKVPIERRVNGKALSEDIALSASDVGADTKGTADSVVSTHNTSASSHNDIRILVTELTNKLNTLADSDDETLDQMSEIVEYIKSNKELIDSITTSKISVSDIVDNLTTNVSTKPLSAAQGVILKDLIDTLQTALNSKADSTDLHSHSNKNVLDAITASYTTEEKTKLSGIEEGANKTVVDSSLSSTSTNPVQNKAVKTVIDNITNGTTPVVKAKDADTVDGLHASDLAKKTDLAKYLPLDGGVLGNGILVTPLNIVGGETASRIGFRNNKNEDLGYLGFDGTNNPVYSSPDAIYKLLHTGNMADHVLSKTGNGTIYGELTLNANNAINGIIPNENTMILRNKTDTSTNTYTDLVVDDGVANLIKRSGGSVVLRSELLHTGNYSNLISTATTSANGFMSSTDKAKLEASNIAYGTCSTEAATAAKVITISGNTNWKLAAGSMITVKFSYTNTASNPTFNVNNTGAKSVWYNTALITTSNKGYAGTANRPMNFMYDGTQYIFIGWSLDSNSTYSNASLGQGYGTCSTASATVAKVVTLSSYALTTGGIISVKFTYAVPANATMNINSKGAKNIFYRGTKIVDGIINAGDIATFIYDGTQYHLISIDKGILNNTSRGALGYASSTAQNLVPTVSTIAYWDGAYSGTNSNLTYCIKGAFGSIVTKNTGDYLSIGGGTLTGNLTISPSGSSIEGGQLVLSAPASDDTKNGIVLDNYNGNFRIFGVASKDGTTKTGVGTSLVIDPYNKTITGGYKINGYTLGAACAKGVDTTATSNSTNLITSGAVYSSLSGKMSSSPSCIEFNGVDSTANHGGYIDFHYNGSTSDYTTRIIEKASGTLSVSGNIVPSEDNSKALGATATAWSSVCSKGFLLNLSSGGYGGINVLTAGTTSTTGEARLTLGNGIATGSDKNSIGKILLYGTKTYYTVITAGTQTANRTITLPNASGTVMLTSNTIAASKVKTGTFADTGVIAATGTDYTTNRIRNTVFTTIDPGAGASTSYANGSIICVYE